jgi:hypothetical protein
MKKYENYTEFIKTLTPPQLDQFYKELDAQQAIVMIEIDDSIAFDYNHFLILTGAGPIFLMVEVRYVRTMGKNNIHRIIYKVTVFPSEVDMEFRMLVEELGNTIAPNPVLNN